MVYFPTHTKEIRGAQIHETLEEKKRLEEENQVNSFSEDDSSSKMRKEIERAEIESKYLVPEVEKWVETESVNVLKDRIKKWLSLKYPVHIIGPTGCGKTTLALQIAKELKRPVVWINGDESITTTDLIGGYSQIETNSIRDKYIHNVFKDKDILKAEWVDNPLTLACKYGYILIYNEFSRSKPIANNVLLSIFSEGILELPTQFGEERYIKVHPDFRAIFTSNPIEYAGIHRVQDALLDRMIGIFMNYHDKETEAKIIAIQSGLEEKNALVIVNMLNSLRKKLPEEGISIRAGIMVARAMELAMNYDKSVIKQLLTDVITSKTKNVVDFNEKMRLCNKL